MARKFDREAWDENRWRWKVCFVDQEKSVYVPVHLYEWYSEACLAADVFREGTCSHYIVWDTILKKPLYDSRLLGNPK